MSLRDAYLRYGRDGAWVLRGCDLEVERAQIHALVGANGCGKSTLLRAAAGALRCERGRLRNDLAACQALLPQDPKALFACDTVAEELLEWRQACGYGEDEVREALERFGLAQREGLHPCDLSGGEQQKLALAKLLLSDPDLVLLDEPTKGLDAASKRVVADALLERSRHGVTVLMASHDLSFIALTADRVTMLFDGQAVCTEAAGAFFDGNLFYRPFEDAFTRSWRPRREERPSKAAS